MLHSLDLSFDDWYDFRIVCFPFDVGIFALFSAGFITGAVQRLLAVALQRADRSGHSRVESDWCDDERMSFSLLVCLLIVAL